MTCRDCSTPWAWLRAACHSTCLAATIGAIIGGLIGWARYAQDEDL